MMKLLSLGCDQESFKTVIFNRRGLSIIIGDSSDKKSSSNGVGKTLALRLVHHCLGARPNKRSTQEIAEWMFTLKFELDGCVHHVSRSGDGREIFFDKKKISLNQLREHLNKDGPFNLSGDEMYISFRSLYKRFTRATPGDRANPIVLEDERFKKDAALLNSLFLLGLDTSLVINKIELRDYHERIKNNIKFLDNNRNREVGYNYSYNGVSPKVRLNNLQEDIKTLKTDVAEMKISKDYELIKKEADNLTSSMRDVEAQIAVFNYQLQGISRSLQNSPDIDRKELLRFYEGLGDVFKPKALKDFEEVECFHNSLISKRKQRLLSDREAILSKLEEAKNSYSELAQARDEQLHFLAGKHALKEYEAVVRQLASKEQLAENLRRDIDKRKELEKDLQSVKEDIVNQDGRANKYLEEDPISWADDRFRQLTHIVYPHAASGITLSNNSGDNKLRYNLTVELQSQESEGYNALRVVCYDWLVFMHGSNHNMGHLWHDNGFFDHIDPKQRAQWLVSTLKTLAITNKQYIISLNSENYRSLLQELDSKERKLIEDTVILKLHGEKPQEKLLGIQVAS